MAERYQHKCGRMGCTKPALYHPIVDLYRGAGYACGALAIDLALCKDHGDSFDLDAYMAEGDWLELVEAYVELGKEPPEREKCKVAMALISQTTFELSE